MSNLTENGCVYICGINNFGQCSNFGLGHIKETYIPTPRKLQFPEKITGVFCCDYSTAIVTKDNDIYMFGDNDYQTISSSNQIITKTNNHQSLYTPIKLDFLKKQVITRDWKIDYICATYMSKEIVILLNSNSQYNQKMTQELYNKQLNNVFTDIDVIFDKDS
jgi:alpha-tubulin suppressor-like RCC1 family protein